MAWIWQRRGEAKSAKARAEQTASLISDYRVTFGGATGQRVLADLLMRCGVMQSSWADDGADAVAFREGRRRIGLEVIEMINADPAAAIRMAQSGQTEDLFDAE